MTDIAGTTETAVPDFAPVVPDELRPFWDAVERGALALPRCPDCATWQWYPGPACPCGYADEFEWLPVAGRGVVHTFSRVERAFLPGVATVPYTVALVDLDEAPGVRLVTTLVGAGAGRPVIGHRVVLRPTVFDTHTLPTFEVVGDEGQVERP